MLSVAFNHIAHHTDVSTRLCECGCLLYTVVLVTVWKLIDIINYYRRNVSLTSGKNWNEHKIEKKKKSIRKTNNSNTHKFMCVVIFTGCIVKLKSTWFWLYLFVMVCTCLFSFFCFECWSVILYIYTNLNKYFAISIWMSKRFSPSRNGNFYFSIFIVWLFFLSLVYSTLPVQFFEYFSTSLVVHIVVVIFCSISFVQFEAWKGKWHTHHKKTEKNIHSTKTQPTSNERTEKNSK